jgi:hypothetical protein
VAVRKTKGGAGYEVELDTGHRLWAFDNFKTNEEGERFFDILPKSVGKMGVFLTEPSKKTDSKNRPWMNITGLIQLGEREWDDGLPVLRRDKPDEYKGREF